MIKMNKQVFELSVYRMANNIESSELRKKIGEYWDYVEKKLEEFNLGVIEENHKVKIRYTCSPILGSGMPWYSLQTTDERFFMDEIKPFFQWLYL